jgi:hypothetical protein
VWPDGNPKNVICTTLKIGDDLWNLWSMIPSALTAAIGEAQKKVDAKVKKGGTLSVTLTGETPNANAKLNATKQFSAVYTPPSAFDAPAPTPAAAPAPAAAPSQPELPGTAPMPADHAMAAPAPVAAMNAAETAKALLASGMDAPSVAAATGLPVNAVIAIGALG